MPGDTPFEDFDLTNFWDDNWYALKEYISEPPSDELIASVEEELGYKLPAAYIWLMKQHNGGIPVNTCYPCDEPTCWAEAVSYTHLACVIEKAEFEAIWESRFYSGAF